ncbi:MAG: hydrogenase maturation protease [Acidobacteria bacterium]|nr:MAG: hydrogenase maturation protease [Acidobacteriota bacterium]
MYHAPMTDYAPIRVLGVGNVLTSDDGLGPTVIKHLEAKYTFPEAVEIIEVGTPGLDFTPYLADAALVIVLDAVRAKDAPGSVRIWRDEELLKAPPVARTSPHEPGLREALMATELTDSSPGNIVLIGVVPETLEAGTGLSSTVNAAVSEVEALVLNELENLGEAAIPRSEPQEPDLWWL